MWKIILELVAYFLMFSASKTIEAWSTQIFLFSLNNFDNFC